MDPSKTSDHYISISEDVINKSRRDFVLSGELEESVLRELRASWRRKMIQAGVINGTIETYSASNPTSVIKMQTHHDPYASPGYPESWIDIDYTFPSTDLAMFIKNEDDELWIPQQDGASDGFYIPQLDGDTDDKDIVTKPNTYAPYDEDDEILNEYDDCEEEYGIDDREEFAHMIMCQFDNVKKRKNKWDCKLKAGAMKINGKSILFSGAKGEFIF